MIKLTPSAKYMSLRNQQIEHRFNRKYALRPKAGFRKWLKKQRNRKIRQIPKIEISNIKYNGWEY
jgi:hypothetical protein